MLEHLFKFPVILLDEDNERNKRRRDSVLGDAGSTEYDLIEGEAELPFHDFVAIEDRWLPNEEGLQEALNGVFNACLVKFHHVLPQLVPWPKEKFKREYIKFVEAFDEKRKKEKEAEEAKAPKIMHISGEQLKKFFELGGTIPSPNEKKDEKEQEDE